MLYIYNHHIFHQPHIPYDTMLLRVAPRLPSPGGHAQPRRAIRHTDGANCGAGGGDLG